MGDRRVAHVSVAQCKELADRWVGKPAMVGVAGWIESRFDADVAVRSVVRTYDQTDGWDNQLNTDMVPALGFASYSDGPAPKSSWKKDLVTGDGDNLKGWNPETIERIGEETGLEDLPVGAKRVCVRVGPPVTASDVYRRWMRQGRRLMEGSYENAVVLRAEPRVLELRVLLLRCQAVASASCIAPSGARLAVVALPVQHETKATVDPAASYGAGRVRTAAENHTEEGGQTEEVVQYALPPAGIVDALDKEAFAWLHGDEGPAHV